MEKGDSALAIEKPADFEVEEETIHIEKSISKREKIFEKTCQTEGIRNEFRTDDG